MRMPANSAASADTAAPQGTSTVAPKPGTGDAAQPAAWRAWLKRLKETGYDQDLLLGMTLVVAMLQMFVGVGQALIYRRQEQLMRQSTESTLQTQRAYVALDQLTSRGRAWTPDWEVVPVWVNHGATPAEVVNAWCDFVVWAPGTELPEPEFQQEAESPVQDATMIGSKDTLPLEARRIKPEDADAVRHHHRRLICHGRLDYRVIFDRTRIFTAEFRYQLEADDKGEPRWTVPRRPPGPASKPLRTFVGSPMQARVMAWWSAARRHGPFRRN
jgi:hypothetical protein